MTNSAALRIILDHLQSLEGHDQALAIAAAERLWRSLETDELPDLGCLCDQAKS